MLGKLSDFLGLCYLLAAWLSPPVQEVTELCLADSGDLLKSGEREDACILGEEAGRIIEELNTIYDDSHFGSGAIVTPQHPPDGLHPRNSLIIYSFTRAPRRAGRDVAHEVRQIPRAAGGEGCRSATGATKSRRGRPSPAYLLTTF